MEGFYTVQFQGVEGWGDGVVTLIGGRVFGGDSGFLYGGTYQQDGGTLKAMVHVKRYVQGIPNVMGRDEFDLSITATQNGSHTLIANGTIPGTPLRLTGTMTKVSNLS
jgi:hypothetical protein